jgi:hypothetical protein
MRFSALITATAALASFSNGHPGHNAVREMQEREIALQGLPRDLSHCVEKFQTRGITAEAAARRARVTREARQARGLNSGRFQSHKLIAPSWLLY